MNAVIAYCCTYFIFLPIAIWRCVCGGGSRVGRTMGASFIWVGKWRGGASFQTVKQKKVLLLKANLCCFHSINSAFLKVQPKKVVLKQKLFKTEFCQKAIYYKLSLFYQWYYFIRICCTPDIILPSRKRRVIKSVGVLSSISFTKF